MSPFPLPYPSAPPPKPPRPLLAPLPANERTFLHWLNHSIYLGTAASGILGVAQHAHKQVGGTDSPWHHTAIYVKLASLTALALSIGMVIYSARQFSMRDRLLTNKSDGPFDDLRGPLVMGFVLLSLLVALFVSTVITTVSSQA